MAEENFFKLKKPFERASDEEKEDLELDSIDEELPQEKEEKRFTEEVREIPKAATPVNVVSKTPLQTIRQPIIQQPIKPTEPIIVKQRPIAKQIAATTIVKEKVIDKSAIPNEISVGKDTYKVESKPKAISNRPKNIKIERIPTGIPGFDELIEGGFEKNSTNLLAGSPGVGKSIFATEFLINGIQNKERCLYVSFEEKREPFFANMAEFGWDLYKYEEEELFTFLEYSPNKVKTMLEEGGGDIESIIVKNKVSRIVLDSISAFTLLFENELEKREASLSLINMIKKWNCTSLLTYESQSIAKEQSIQFKTLDFESDSITVLYLVRNKNKRERFIEVLKMRGTNHSNNTYGYLINSKGIEVSKKPTETLPEL